MYLYLYFSFPISVATKLETNFNPFTVFSDVWQACKTSFPFANAFEQNVVSGRNLFIFVWKHSMNYSCQLQILTSVEIISEKNIQEHWQHFMMITIINRIMINMTSIEMMVMKTVIFPKCINWLFGRISPFILFLRVFDVKPTKCNPSPKSKLIVITFCANYCICGWWAIIKTLNLCVLLLEEKYLFCFFSRTAQVFSNLLYIFVLFQLPPFDV